MIFYKADGLTLNSGEVKFEPINEVLPIVFYLLHALWDFVNRGLDLIRQVELTFATWRIFLMPSDTTFRGFSTSDPSAIMLAKSRSRMDASRT